MAEIGIDLGTTNSEVAHLQNMPVVLENRGSPKTPSVVAFDPDTGQLLVGQSAKDQALVLPSVESVKRYIGTDKVFTLGKKEYGPVEISALILKELKEVAEKRLAEPIDGTVITVPAYFATAQKEATKRAGELAGLKEIRLLAEPIAAALSYGAEDTVLVYDLGGGTFDVAIIDCFDNNMIAVDGDNWLGGDDFDKRLMQHLADEIKKKCKVEIESNKEAWQLAKIKCEQAKIELSVRESTRIVFQKMVDGKLVDVTVKVTQSEFEDMIKDLIDRTIAKTESVFELAKKKDPTFSKESITEVLLVGGSTYVPAVQSRLRKYFAREPSHKVNPDLAVALGAAVHTATGRTDPSVHKVRVAPLPKVTQAGTVEVCGRTSAGAAVRVSNGASVASTTADEKGKFSVKFELSSDAINNVTVEATATTGEVRRCCFDIRHDSGFTGEEEKGRRESPDVNTVLSRTLGIGLTGQDNLLGVVVPAQTLIPCSVKNTSFAVVSSVPNQPGTVDIQIYEGDLPYAPLNTHLATLTLETAASPSTVEPIEVNFQMTEDHLLTATARLVNFPDKKITARIQCRSPSGVQLHVIERSERLLNTMGGRLRPEDKARVNKGVQALTDLCEQYRSNESEECYGRIKETGLSLRQDLDRIEASQLQPA